MKKSVVCIIENNKKELLLQKKTMTYKKNPGVWTFFGGVVDKGETPKEAIIRELKEEIGIKMGVKFLFNFEFDTEVHVFSGILNDISKISLGEGAGFAFFSKEEFRKITKSNKFINKIMERRS